MGASAYTAGFVEFHTGYDVIFAGPLRKDALSDTYAQMVANPLAYPGLICFVGADEDGKKNGFYYCYEAPGFWGGRENKFRLFSAGPSSNDEPVIIIKEGPAGARGPEGPQGPEGPRGPAGEDGKTTAGGGANEDGAQGPPGAEGKPGPRGPEGPEGPQGAQGGLGNDGARGATGLLGPGWVIFNGVLTPPLLGRGTNILALLPADSFGVWQWNEANKNWDRVGSLQPGAGTKHYILGSDPTDQFGNNGELITVPYTIKTEKRFVKEVGRWRKYYDNTGGEAPTTVTYEATYTTTTSDYLAKCGSGTGAAQTASVAGYATQSTANAAAKQAAIDKIVCQLAPRTYSSTQSFTARCGPGTTGNEVTRQATRTSTDTQDAADKAALAAAKSMAESALVCTPVVVTFSATKSFTASCGAGTTGPTVTREATRSGTTQDEADRLALTAATEAATSALVCTPIVVTFTATKSFTASCGTGTTGPAVTREATRTSTQNQAEADRLALAAATEAATGALVCTPVVTAPTVFSATKSFTASCGAGTTGADVTKTETRTAATQEEADRLALAAATASAKAALVCTVIPTVPSEFNVNLVDGQADAATGTGLTTDGTGGAALRYNRPPSTATSDTSAMDTNVLLNGVAVALINTLAYLEGSTFYYDMSSKRYSGKFTNGDAPLTFSSNL